MYKLPYFIETDDAKIRQFMQEHYFALITGFDGTYPVATQIPLEIEFLEDEIIFSGHLMRNTDHHKAFVKHPQVMVLFTGPHNFVSASWYTDPHQGSTWNYMTVQAKGEIRFLDEQATYEAVKKITHKHEINSTAAFENLSDEYVHGLVKAIVAFKIKVHNIENVFKLSQNRDQQSKRNIIQKLLEQNTDSSNAIAAAMQERL